MKEAKKLINVKATKDFVLQMGRERIMLDGKPKWTRVSGETIEAIERKMREEIRKMVWAAPTCGKTL